MLQRTILRLSKRKKEPLLFSENIKAIKEDWSKYDDRLIDCINRGDIAKLKHTLNKKSISPTKLNSDGETVLHIAVKKSQVDCVEAILTLHPDLSSVNAKGQTVYHLAAKNGDVIMLKKLLDYSRWNLDIQDENKMSALHCAVLSGEAACIKLLLDNNSPLDLKDDNNRTPLLLAISESNEKIATTLILHGADINLSDNLGRTPIVLACSQGMSQAVTLLVSKGASSPIAESQEKLDEVFSTPFEVQTKTQLGSEKNTAENSSPTCINRNSSGKLRRQTKNFDDSSFTSSIIESLRGLESTGFGKELNTQEDQNKDKSQMDDMQKELAKKDLKILELQAELLAIHNKVKLEIEKRLSAEAEASLAKQQLEDCQVSRKKSNVVKQVLFEKENSISDENICTSKDTPIICVVENSKENDIGVENDTGVEKDIVDGGSDNSIENDSADDNLTNGDADENDSADENLTNGDVINDNCQLNNNDSDSDEVSTVTGYRKKSLGTAKQHIEMLEEHILSLEEDINQRDKEIHDLKMKLQSTKELVDLNNNTTVSLETYNQLKSEKKLERIAFKEKIKGLEAELEKQKNEMKLMEEERVTLVSKQADIEAKLASKMEFQSLRDQLENELAEKEKQRMMLDEKINNLENIIKNNTAERNDAELEHSSLQDRLLNESHQNEELITQLRGQVTELEIQISEAKRQFDENEADYNKQIERYRVLMLRLYKGVLDPKIGNILSNIAAMRDF